MSQPGKKAVDLIVDFLSHIWEYAKQQITREIGAVADLGVYRVSYVVNRAEPLILFYLPLYSTRRVKVLRMSG